MEGMSIDQYREVLQFIRQYHAYGHYVNPADRIKIKGKEFHLHIKDVDSCFDMREGIICAVSLRGMAVNVRFAVNHFNNQNPAPEHFQFSNLYDWVMHYLTGEWTNLNILRQCYIIEK